MRMRFRKNGKFVNYTSFDITDGIENEMDAIGSIDVIVEDFEGFGDIPGRLEDRWEDIHRASERHGFAITPALVDAYAKAMAPYRVPASAGK